MTEPQGWEQEWVAAFAWAERARAVSAEVIERVRSGDLSLTEAFAAADIDPFVGRIFAQKVCEAAPGIGKVRTRRTMAGLDIADDTTMAGLADPPRTELLDALTAPTATAESG